ncbi:MAG: metallophosphoesterase [bacterium]
MRIYAVADIHGRADRMALIRDNVERHRPDVLVVAGDITHRAAPRSAIASLGDLPLPVLAVRGNADRAGVEGLIEEHPGMHSLHLKEISLDGVDFVGVHGTIPLPFRSRVCFREKALRELIEPLLKETSVLVAHPPPLGVLDEVLGRLHAGSRALLEIIRSRQPALLLCGHIHERPGSARVGRTLVVNCNLARRGAGALIEIEKGEVLNARMLE